MGGWDVTAGLGQPEAALSLESRWGAAVIANRFCQLPMAAQLLMCAQPLSRSDLDRHSAAWLSLTAREQPRCPLSFPDPVSPPELVTPQESNAPMSSLEVCCHQWDGGPELSEGLAGLSLLSSFASLAWQLPLGFRGLGVSSPKTQFLLPGG